jgi:hypothetical protein
MPGSGRGTPTGGARTASYGKTTLVGNRHTRHRRKREPSARPRAHASPRHPGVARDIRFLPMTARSPGLPPPPRTTLPPWGSGQTVAGAAPDSLRRSLRQVMDASHSGSGPKPPGFGGKAPWAGGILLDV